MSSFAATGVANPETTDANHQLGRGMSLQEILDSCPDAECMECALLVCPSEEPLHFHHDGCPSCQT
ncbi:hypothetical protein ml_46 [Mollivirus sibericum]|uniref:hypothetical protein n=1 Tax=Mollivirus sibericum TaxID=1678078 RepID=UPI0006B2E028|nr:hypothetical protein ml_46 [Mollivirus sibericum]ALD61848.1 hypothetical protein ml_46 [Mollivirus sibericum]